MSKLKIKKDVRTKVNYILFLMLVILVAFLSVRLYKNYETNKYSKSVLDRTISTVSYEDLDSAKKEFAGTNFVLISYTKSKEVRDLEKKLKKSIINNNMQNNFLYLDASNLMLNDNYIETLNNKFELKDDKKITSLPAIIFYMDGKVTKVLSSDNRRLLSNDDFLMLLDNYELIERK